MLKETRIYLEIERSKLEREKARLVLEKSIALYIIFMMIGVIGFVFDYLDSVILNALIFLGICILIIGTIPYIIIVRKEEKKIDRYLK